MPTSPELETSQKDSDGGEKAALACLRQSGENPFADPISDGVEDSRCEQYDVPEFLERQRKDILAIINLYRQEDSRSSQVFPILGEAGAGKTHLLAYLKRTLDMGDSEEGEAYQARIRREFKSNGQFLIVSEGFPAEDPLTFLRVQAVDHLLARQGGGARLLRLLSVRTTARILVDAIRRLEPAQRLGLLPVQGVWDNLGRRLGWQSATQAVFQKIDAFILACERDTLPDLAGECARAGIEKKRALELIEELVNKDESNDIDGNLRRNLITGFAQFALLGDSANLRAFLQPFGQVNEENRSGPVSVERRFLRVLLELLRILRLPIILTFDQLEDHLPSIPQERRERLHSFFSGLVRLTNNIPGVCILVFTERSLWQEAVEEGQQASDRDRLNRGFTLPGQPPSRAVDLDQSIPKEILYRLIQARIRPILKDFPSQDKLSRFFPFKESVVEKVAGARTIRDCLEQLSGYYAKIMYLDIEDLRRRLNHQWRKEKQHAQKVLDEGALATEAGQKIHKAIQEWLNYAASQQLLTTPASAEVELLHHGHEVYGWLTVLRLQGQPALGLGIGVWFGVGRGKAPDLEARLAFFGCNQFRALLLFHLEGQDMLLRRGGRAAELFQQALDKGLDVHVERLENDDLGKLLAVPAWLHTITHDVEVDLEKSLPLVNELIRKETGHLLEVIQHWWKAPEHAS